MIQSPEKNAEYFVFTSGLLVFKPWEYARVHRSRAQVIIGGEGMIARIFVITITMDMATFHNKLVVVLNSKHPLLLEHSKEKYLWIYDLKPVVDWKYIKKFGSIMLYHEIRDVRGSIDHGSRCRSQLITRTADLCTHIYNGAISPGWTVIQIFQTQLELSIDRDYRVW